jgi:hypothetical protein
MSLRDGYGVLLGTLADYKRDDPNDFGRFMHGVLTVAAPDGRYKCAVDVDTQHGVVPVNWRIHPLRSAEWATLFALPNGWHPLASAASGAVDYIRDPRLRDLIFVPSYMPRPPLSPDVWLGHDLPHQRPILTPQRRGEVAPAQPGAPRAPAASLRAPVARAVPQDSTPAAFRSVAGEFIMLRPPWNAGSSEEALTDLEAVLASPLRIAVFGEPFRDGKGVHNIHQNQGDPIDSIFSAENAIWQDGITVALRADGTAAAFLNKFGTQADATDDEGHPLKNA